MLLRKLTAVMLVLCLIGCDEDPQARTIRELGSANAQLRAEVALRSSPEAGVVEQLHALENTHKAEVLALEAQLRQSQTRQVISVLEPLQNEIHSLQQEVIKAHAKVDHIRVSGGQNCNCSK